MRILIVNGYSKSFVGKNDYFRRYQDLIQEIFKNQNDFIDTDLEFCIRDGSDLDDFLYEIDSPYTKKSSAVAFDQIDFVFIEGNVSLLPWNTHASKMMVLLRMCIRVKKCLFASGFAMQALVYLAATNIDQDIEVINGNGLGGKIQDIDKYVSRNQNLHHNQYYLDNETGDLYQYFYETSEWLPKMNVGVHYTRATSKHNSFGRHVTNPPIYKPKTSENNKQLYLSNRQEDFCYIKKEYQQHWSIASLPLTFVIPSTNLWDIHKFNFVNQSRTFIVLAEAKKCPQILIFGSYCIGTLFNITKKYEDTVKILKNFIITKLREMKTMNKQDFVTLEKASELCRKVNNPFSSPEQSNVRSSSQPAENLKAIVQSKSSTHRSRPTTASINIPHSGYALSHNNASGNLLVENNCIRNDLKIRISRENSASQKRYHLSNYYSEDQNLKTQENFNSFNNSKNSSNLLYSPSTRLKDFNVSTRNYENKSGKDIRLNTVNSFTGTFQSKEYESYNNQNFTMNTKDTANFNKNKAELALMLYPDLPRNTIREEQFWIPGQLSKSRPSTATSKTKKIITLETNTSKNSTNTASKRFIDTHSWNVPKPCVRTSGEYFTDQQRFLKEQKANSQKSIGPAFFKTGNKVKPDYIQNYVITTYSDPAANHKFREVKKDKWVGGAMNVV